MQSMFRRVKNLLKNEDGVTAMEYGLIAAATVVAISVFMPGIGSTLSGIFSQVSTAL